MNEKTRNRAPGKPPAGGKRPSAPAKGERERLRAAQEAILNGLPHGVLAADVETGRFVHANAAICRMLGFTSDELLGLSAADIHPPAEVPRVIAQFEKALRGESEGLADVSLRRKDGGAISADIRHSFLEFEGRPCLLGVFTDISARKQAEEALRESDAALQTLLRNVRDGVWSLSYPDFTPLFISSSVERIYGRSREEFVQNPRLWEELVHSEDRESIGQAKKDLAEKGYAYRECRIVHSDGAIRWIADRSKLAYGDDGLPVRVEGVVSDITERKRSEKQLSALAAVVEQSEDLIAVKDLDLRVVAANSAFAKISGHASARELIGKTDAEIFGVPPGTEPVRTSMEDDRNAQRLRPGERLSREEALVAASGGVRHVLTKKYPVFDAHRKLIGTGAISTDITERKRAEEGLRASEGKLRSIFRSMADVVLVLDREGRYLEIAPTSTDLLYRPPQELIGRTVGDVFPAALADLCLTTIREALRSGKSVPIDYQMEIAGRPLWFAGAVTPYTADSVVWVARDITDRKMAEESRWRSEERFNQLAEQSRTVAWEVDAEGLYTYVSHVAEAVLGYRADELVGRMHFYDLHPEEGREAFKVQTFEAFRRREAFVDFRNQALTKDGRLVWLSTNGMPLTDASGAWRGYRGSDTDITDRLRAEASRRESEEKYRLLVEQATDIVYSMTAKGVITYVSPSWTRLLGQPVDSVLNRPFQAFVHPEDVPACMEALRQTLETGRSRSNVEYRVRHLDGTYRWHITNATPIPGADGAVASFVAIARDITERKRMEDELRDWQERFDRLARQSRTYAWEVDAEGVFTHVSPSVETVLGYRPEELVGRPFYDLIPEAERAAFTKKTYELGMGHEQFKDFLNPVATKEGQVLWLTSNGITKRNAAGDMVGYQGIDTDVTERRQAEEEVRRMSVRLRDLTRHVQEVREEESRRIAVWLHDEVGQMLTRARMDAMLLEVGVGNAGGEPAAALASLKRTLDDAVVSIRNISSDLRPPILDDFGLVAVLEWVVHENEKRLKIPFRLEIDGVPDSLDPDLSVAFYRIVRECLANIARHARASAVEVRLVGDGSGLTLEVRDDGCGMDPALAEAPSSFGIGQMRERAAALGGRMQIESQPGNGTAVRVSAPLRRPGESGAPP